MLEEVNNVEVSEEEVTEEVSAEEVSEESTEEVAEEAAEEEADEAIQTLDGSDLEGRALKVNKAKPKTSRPPRQSYDNNSRY